MANSTFQPLTIDQQIADMREQYPGFRVSHSCYWMVLWEGDLTPFMQRYRTQILYSALRLDVAGIERRIPHVEIAQPLLKKRRNAEPIPHVFSNRISPERPRLCLYRGDEWSPYQRIADTILPWTVDWLACYEGWLATGAWTGGGHDTRTCLT